MSDLREALEQFCQQLEAFPDVMNAPLGEEQAEILEDLRGMLAAHPAEPAPVQAEAVGIRAFDDPDRADLAEILGATGVRMLLDHPAEPAPVASRERVADVLHSQNITYRPAADRIYDALLAAGVFREPPTAEQVAMKLSLVRFSDEESDRMIELTMREAWPLADAVVDLLGGATNG